MYSLFIYYFNFFVFIIYTLLYIDEKQKQAEGKEEGEPRRRMSPTSSPVPRLASAPSAVLTVHTIASRSPHRHRRASNQGEGRAPTLSASG